MTAQLIIRPPRPVELQVLQRIEVDAGAMFAEIGMDVVAEHDPFSLFELRAFLEAGCAWVAAPVGGDLVAYLVTEQVDGCGHLEQLTVHPSHGRQGVGRRLIAHADGWAAAGGMPALTLTTFTDVPWNGPYYERLGFRVLAPEEVTPGLAALRVHEAEIGLDAWPRACMRREIGRR